MTAKKERANKFEEYLKEANSRLMGNQTILGNMVDDEPASSEPVTEVPEPVRNTDADSGDSGAAAPPDEGKDKQPSKKRGRSMKSKKDVSKKMEDNQAAVMFYLPEDVKLDLAIYAKKHKKAVAEILRELVVEKIYS